LLLSDAFQGRFGGHFGAFFGKVKVFLGKGEPSILDDSTAFWLDFEGSGRPETMLKQEKRSTEIRGFLVVEKTPPE